MRRLFCSPFSALYTALIAVSLTGCDSGADVKFHKDERNLAQVEKTEVDSLQWRLDDSIAADLFDDNTKAGMNRYLAFRKCHEEPPTRQANKKICAFLQARVAKQEAKNQEKAQKEKAAW